MHRSVVIALMALDWGVLRSVPDIEERCCGSYKVRRVVAMM